MFVYPDREWGKKAKYFYRKLKSTGISENRCIDMVNALRKLWTYQTSQRKKTRVVDESDSYFDNFVDGEGY